MAEAAGGRGGGGGGGARRRRRWWGRWCRAGGGGGGGGAVQAGVQPQVRAGLARERRRGAVAPTDSRPTTAEPTHGPTTSAAPASTTSTTQPQHQCQRQSQYHNPRPQRQCQPQRRRRRWQQQLLWRLGQRLPPGRWRGCRRRRGRSDFGRRRLDGNTVPGNCAPVNYSGMVYQRCGNTWYQPQGSQYVVVNPPY